ncbi:hypothetical protein SAMD00019534_062270 [Acytostelium subglobosum LB1]|uniref:hypothetical protein n=1 Tax=Acytostelium subglobosum LB1 TaxID=1410327 RepID=UPI000644D887|nr:hypothetical protein SAMD00019534_062270 [Acytostelium subglobosum LB1]GAM23052.1 hypothetical protein SAMD00019534_062270 [Acytostelium subglobosum LB1]|eukprot:XP_012754279.1 hypothetical protein SAMD00019534_062270 [Acytostelium subglobosum LB1]
MSDVKDILGMSQPKESTSSTVDSILKKKNQTPKRPDGPARGGSIIEILQQSFLNLEGETLSFAAPVTTQAGLKEKRKIKVAWEPRGIRSSARNDNLVLYHYSKTTDKVEDYKYSRFNKKMDVLVYNEEEYDLYLRDPNWTREDTDQLLDLCKRFDTRFIVVYDRFEGSTPRTIEDLKERYYKVQSKLVELRTRPEEDPYHNPLTNYSFNKVYETERKVQADRLFHLTREQVDEQDRLVEKYQGIEKHLLKHSKTTKSIYKMANLAITNGPMKHYNQNDVSSESSTKKKKKKNQPEGGEDRSVVLSNRQTQRVESTLYDLHIGMPFNNQLAKRLYNDLKQDIITLLDIQKYYIEKRYHCEILRTQKEHLEREIEEMNLPAEALAIHVDEENEPAVVGTGGSSVSMGDNESEPTPQQQATPHQPQPPTLFQMYSGGVDISESSDNISLSSSTSSLRPLDESQSTPGSHHKSSTKKRAHKGGEDLTSTSSTDLHAGSIESPSSSTTTSTSSTTKKRKSTSASRKKQHSTTDADASSNDTTINVDIGNEADNQPPLKKSRASAGASPTKEKKEKKKSTKRSSSSGGSNNTSSEKEKEKKKKSSKDRLAQSLPPPPFAIPK